MADQFKNAWWRKLDNGPKMILSLILYLELKGILGNPGVPEVAAEALGRRYWYACPSGCTVRNGVPDHGLAWIMLYSAVLRRNNDPEHPDTALVNAEGASDFASYADKAQDILDSPHWHSNPPAGNKPWGWFNPQSEAEAKHFWEIWDGDGRKWANEDDAGVYALMQGQAERPRSTHWVVLTPNQEKTHCDRPPHNWPCGN